MVREKWGGGVLLGFCYHEVLNLWDAREEE